MSSANKSRNRRAGAGIGGTVVGTLAIYAIQKWPAETEHKNLFLHCVPAFTVAATTAVYWLWKQIVLFCVEVQSARARVKMEEIARKALDDKATTEDNKDIIRKHLEAVKLSELDMQIARVKKLHESYKSQMDT